MNFWYNLITVIFVFIFLSHAYCEIMCFSCNSRFNENCSANTEKTAKILCDEEDKCITYVDVNTTIYRGCSAQLDENVIASKSCGFELCNNHSVCLNNSNCIFCDEENCNDDESVFHTCIECDSTIGQDCKHVQFDQYEITCKNSYHTGCYHYEKGNIIKRGCLSHLSANDELLQDCLNSANCKTCIEDNCNTKESLQRCYSCNSVEDKSCATLQTPLTDKICDEYFDTCKVYVKPNSTTHRGCSKEIDEAGIECSAQTVNCKQCSENLCNGGIFPSNRLSCYQCKGLPSSDCSNNINDEMIFPCEKYNFRDSCYLFVDKNNLTVRGCLSDSEFFSTLCQSDLSVCDVCQTSNCNMKNVMRPPTMNCIKCDTSLDPKCIWGFSESSKTPCTKNVYHYQEESCFTFQVSNTTLIRGCTLDSNACKISNSCQLCREDGCNNEKKIAQYCIECNSEENKSCYDRPEKLKNVSCEGNITYEHRGCYTWINELDQITRGCFSSLSTTKKFKCINDHEHCEICYQNNNCNISPKNVGKKIYHQYFYIILAMNILIAVDFIKH